MHTLSTILRGTRRVSAKSITRYLSTYRYKNNHFLNFHIDNHLAETFEYNIPDIFSYITNKKLIYIILHGTSYKQ